MRHCHKNIFSKTTFLLAVKVAGSLFFIFLDTPERAVAAEDQVSMSANVADALTLELSSNLYEFGNLIPGTPKKGSQGVTATVTTSAGGGYNLSISDGIAGGWSALLHGGDGTTRIPDCPFTIATPELWIGGTTKGVGVTVYAADTSKNEKRGAGTTFDDPLNKYAAIPQLPTIIHYSPGFKGDPDNTFIAFTVDVSNSQKTGFYSGGVTLSATAVLE